MFAIPGRGAMTCGCMQMIPYSTLSGFYTYCTSHLQGNTSSFLGFYSRIFPLFFDSVLYLQGVHSGEFIILMHRVYKHYKHLKRHFFSFATFLTVVICVLSEPRATSADGQRADLKRAKSKCLEDPPPPPPVKRMAV